MILDGYGINDRSEGNAIKLAKTPVMDLLYEKYPHAKGYASGLDVGLPKGQMGNSEVGHLNIGAGRIVYQELTRISKSIEDGDEKAELVLNAMIYQVAKSIGAAAVALFGKIDAILLTGGIAHSEYVISRLKERVSFLAPVYVYPGEDELEALAVNVLGALRGELPIQVYK